MAPDRVGDELRLVVAADKGRRTALPDQPVQHVDDIG
jgi:hypothetical protein